MTFEFDSAKSAVNLENHGIDFIGAQALWSDRIRIISVRRARDEETAAYFQE